MTIESETRKTSAFTSGTALPFSFKIFDTSEAYVVEQDLLTGIETVLVEITDYTVALNPEQNSNPGGTVTLVTTIPANTQVIVSSAVLYKQNLAITNLGGFFPEAINSALDKLTILVQQSQEELDRSVKYPISDPSLGTTMPAQAQRLGTVLAFNEVNGEPEVGPDIASVGTVADNVENINTVADNIDDVVIVADNVTDVTNFADVYQGGKTSNPTLRNNGDPLLAGDLYFNTTSDEFRVYNGSAWFLAYVVSPTGNRMNIVGNFNSATNSSNFPAAGDTGDAYIVSAGFTLAAPSGAHVLQTDDFIFANKDGATGIDADWNILQGNLEAASATKDGYVSQVAQSFAGAKTFISSPIVPTLSLGDTSTKAANAAFVDAALLKNNTIINGGCQVAQHSQFTCGAANDAISKLTGAVGFGEVNRIRGYTTQTASAGTIDQLTGDAISTTGFGVGFTGVTLAGAGKLHFIHRIKAKDAARYKGGNGSFSVKVYHDVGSAKTITVYIRDPDVEDVFSVTSAISNDGGTSVDDTTVTTINYENIDFSSANPERGIEIEIEIDCGAITTKNFKISELQLVPGPISRTFEHMLSGQTLALCKEFYRRITSDGIDYMPMVGQVEGTTASYGAFQFPTEMRVPPTLETSGSATDYRIWDNGTGAVVCNVVPQIRNPTKSFCQVKFLVASDPGLAAANAGSIGFANSSGFLGFISEL